MTPSRVGMLGAGMMAQGFDRPGAERIMSMAHAFSRSPRFEIAGFFDASPGRAAAAEQRWNVPPSPRERDAWLDAGWDVVYIATPDDCHGADVRDVLARQPRAVLVEKPLSVHAEDALSLLTEARGRGVLMMVDFPRRRHSGIQKLRQMTLDGLMSEPLAAFIAVSGGAVHNLPHSLDLIHTVWGGDWTIERPAHVGQDMTFLQWRRDKHAFSMGVTERQSPYYVWEAHLYCDQGKVELSHSPEMLEWSTPAPHPEFAGYQVLTPVFRCGMEDEPLLSFVVEALGDGLDDPVVAARLLEHEMSAHRLSAAALKWF
jgi:hypothetical protein